MGKRSILCQKGDRIIINHAITIYRNQKKTEEIIGISLALLSGILWAVSSVSGQILFDEYHMDVNWLLPVRMIVSGIILLTVYRIRCGKNTGHAAKKDWMILIVIESIVLAGAQYFFWITLDYSNAPTATFLQYLAPAFVLIIVCIRKLRYPGVSMIIALLCALAGVLLLATHGDFGKLSFTVSTLVTGLASALFLAFYTLNSEGLSQKWDTLFIVGIASLIGGSLLGLLTRFWKISVHLDSRGFFALVFVIVAGAILPYYIYTIAVKLINGALASILSSSELLATFLLSVIFNGTPINMYDIIGMIFILIMIVFSSYACDKLSTRFIDSYF